MQYSLLLGPLCSGLHSGVHRSESNMQQLTITMIAVIGISASMLQQAVAIKIFLVSESACAHNEVNCYKGSCDVQAAADQ
jgi:hypothetical protein